MNGEYVKPQEYVKDAVAYLNTKTGVLYHAAYIDYEASKENPATDWLTILIPLFYQPK